MKSKSQAIKILNLVRNLDRSTLLGSEAAQALLSELGILALPQPGHGCPDCNQAGAVYCFGTAVKNIRQMPDFGTEGGYIQ